jgi:hypothetical protein
MGLSSSLEVLGREIEGVGCISECRSTFLLKLPYTSSDEKSCKREDASMNEDNAIITDAARTSNVNVLKRREDIQAVHCDGGACEEFGKFDWRGQ